MLTWTKKGLSRSLFIILLPLIALIAFGSISKAQDKPVQSENQKTSPPTPPAQEEVQQSSPEKGYMSQDELLQDSDGNPKKFLLQLSGKVFKEQFSNARASLTLEQPDPDSLNPYLVVIEGFPKTNSRNVFYWHSDATDMQFIPNEIICDINTKRSYLRSAARGPQIHFFYLSPVLLSLVDRRKQDDLKIVERNSLPSRVPAQAGRLKMVFSGDTVSGSVWMKGYDGIQHSYVDYHASFSGMLATRIDPTWQTKEPHRPQGIIQSIKLK